MTDSEKLNLILSELRIVKQDVSDVKQDISDLKQDISNLKQDVSDLKQDVTSINLHLENVTDKNIAIVAENHCNLIAQLNAAIPRVSKEPMYEIKVSYLEEDVKKLKKAVKELQDRTA